MVYSLDRNLTFDPYLLDENVTPARIKEAIRNEEYLEAVMLSLRLNEERLIVEAVESTPAADVAVVAPNLPMVYVVKLLEFLAQHVGKTRHVEFYLVWVKSLLWAHTLELKRTQAQKPAFAAVVRNLMRNLNVSFVGYVTSVICRAKLLAFFLSCLKVWG
jgi:periodic tryptophan protein 2